MDSITQAALGAVIAEAGFRHRLGGKAVAFGALCGVLPDFDVVARVAGEWHSLAFHRSWTHSLVVLPLVAPLVGVVGKRLFRGEGPRSAWMHLAFWALVTHPLLDVCTTYGTQLLAPISRTRFSLDAVSIIDPVYTVPLLIALALARISRVPEGIRRGTAAAALALGVAYLGLGWSWSQTARQAGVDELARLGEVPTAMRTPPMLLIGPNRKVVARTEAGGLYVGLMSALVDDEVDLEPLASETGPALDAVLETWEGQTWDWFVGGFMQVQLEAHADGSTTVIMTDQKYGLYSVPTSSVFQAVGEVEADGTVRSVRPTRHVDQAISPGDELRLGWTLALGGTDAAFPPVDDSAGEAL